MTEGERQRKAAERGIVVFVLAMFFWMLAGCCAGQSRDLTPENDCPMIQAGFATLDQLPRILK